jgi:hypothetical protein
MAELSHPWRIYAHLQSALSRSCRVNNDSWGIEAGLDIILASSPDISPPTDEDIVRTINSKRIREHRRSKLRLRHLRPDEDRIDPEQALLARNELRRIRSQVRPSDWALLGSVGLGDKYAEIAKKTGSSAGAVRVSVLRLRRHLTLKAA